MLSHASGSLISHLAWVPDQAWKPHRNLLIPSAEHSETTLRLTYFLHLLQAIEERPWSRRFAVVQAMREI